MIWIWICACISFVRKLFGPPEVPLPAIDPNAPCPSCGHTDGHIRAIQDLHGMKVQHTCHVCKALWTELPIVRGPVLGTDKEER